MALDPLLRPAEVADLLGVPLSTLYKWQHDGSAPDRIRIGKHVRYSPAAVEKWIADSHVQPRGAA